MSTWHPGGVADTLEALEHTLKETSPRGPELRGTAPSLPPLRPRAMASGCDHRHLFCPGYAGEGTRPLSDPDDLGHMPWLRAHALHLPLDKGPVPSVPAWQKADSVLPDRKCHPAVAPETEGVSALPPRERPAGPGRVRAGSGAWCADTRLPVNFPSTVWQDRPAPVGPDTQTPCPPCGVQPGAVSGLGLSTPARGG